MLQILQSDLSLVKVGGVGQAHVHKISYSRVGQWKLANRSVMINRN